MKERRRKRERRRPPEKPLDKKLEKMESAPGFTHIHLHHVFIVIGVIIILLVTVGVFELYGVYASYAAIVDRQLDHRSFQRRNGIYAAPRRVSVGEQISQDELNDRLLRAGYLPERQGNQANQFSSGSFVIEGDKVKLRTNESARDGQMPEAVEIEFGGGAKSARIISVKDAGSGKRLEGVALPTELVTMDGVARTHPRGFASYNDFPPMVAHALIAIEDKNFFLHGGVDVTAICRAAWENWRHGEIREGGSTITQQLIKTSLLTPERTYERKFREAMLAMALEQRLSKEEIFTLYANRLYLGQSGMTAVYGFRQAARVFFDKDMSELSLAEAALIAGLAQAPNRYSPYLRPEAAIARRNTVLDAMAQSAQISQEEAASAKSEKLVVVPPAEPDDAAAQHFTDYVKRELARRGFSEKDEPNLKIETTLDLDLQQAANVAVKTHMTKLDRAFGKSGKGLPEAALIAIDPHTGEILAMVGGRNYGASQLNRVTDARRQPGSVFKPIVYTAALMRGISPETTFTDAPREFVFGQEIYRPENYGGKFSGRTVTLREGVVRSLNVVAVDAALRVGLSKVADTAQRMGLPRPEAYPSMALGAFEVTPFEAAQAYSTFANGGTRVTPFGIKSVVGADLAGDKTTPTRTKVFNASMAHLITETLSDVVNRGTAVRVRGLGYNGPAAGKTGSSRDSWFVGYTPKLLVAVWVGFDDHRDLRLTGSQAAAPIWTDFVKRALALRPDLRAEKFTPPTGTEVVEIDPTTGMLAHEDCPSRKSVTMDVSKIPPYCSKHHPRQASPDRKNYSALADHTRRRSARRVRPQTDSPPPGDRRIQPLIDQDKLIPELLSPIIRR